MCGKVGLCKRRRWQVGQQRVVVRQVGNGRGTRRHVGHVGQLERTGVSPPAWQGERHMLLVQPQRVGRNTERLGFPVLCVPFFNVFGPQPKAAQRVTTQQQQRLLHGFLICQPGIQQLLHGPGCFAKLGQAHHARAAFECVEHPAQGGLFGQVGWLCGQGIHTHQPICDHFAGLFQEHVHQVVFFQVHCRQDGRGLWHRRCRQSRLLGHHSNRDGGALLYGNKGLLGRVIGTALHAPGEQPQLALCFVVDKQGAGHRTLVVQHVDHEAEGPQAVAQFLERCGAAHGVAHFGLGQKTFHGATHPHHGQRGLVQAQQRQHAPHLRQAIGHGHQRLGVCGVAEELVHQFFDFAQGGA